MSRKDYYFWEKIAKGFANHRRIEILELLNKKPDLSVFAITEELKINFRTVSDHLRKLVISGLVQKRHKGNTVLHSVTARGAYVLTFIKKLK